MKGAMNGLSIDPAFSERNVNEGFSGGERKRHEILQLELIRPKFAILDETDSGLDVDALKIVSDGVNRVKSETEMGVVLITHTIRLLRQIPVDKVHVIIDGKIVAEGGAELAEAIDNAGYEQFAVKA
jgi:Fe-S cluster assembly ATP-binding protein